MDLLKRWFVPQIIVSLHFTVAKSEVLNLFLQLLQNDVGAAKELASHFLCLGFCGLSCCVLLLVVFLYEEKILSFLDLG